MGVWQHRKLPWAHFNKYIGIIDDEWLHTLWATQHQKKIWNISIIVILTGIWTSTWLCLFWYIDRYFQLAIEWVNMTYIIVKLYLPIIRTWTNKFGGREYISAWQVLILPTFWIPRYYYKEHNDIRLRYMCPRYKYTVEEKAHAGNKN